MSKENLDAMFAKIEAARNLVQKCAPDLMHLFPVVDRTTKASEIYPNLFSSQIKSILEEVNRRIENNSPARVH